MKNIQGYLIIGASIIIASIIVSVSIYNKETTSLDDCYKKVYKSELKKELKSRKKLEKLRKEKGLEMIKHPKDAEATSAAMARYICLKGDYLY